MVDQPILWSEWFKVLETSPLGVGQFGKFEGYIAYSWAKYAVILTQAGVVVYTKALVLVAKCATIEELRTVLAGLDNG